MSISTNLLAGYKLEEASGSRLDVLSVKPLTETGSVTQSAGLLGNSVSGFSSSNYLSRTSALITSAPFSVSLWFYLTGSASGDMWLLGDASNNALWGLNFTGGRSNAIQFVDGAGNSVNFSGSFTTSTWHHVVTTDSGSTMKLYYDGVYRATLGATFNNTPTTTWIGGWAGLTGGMITSAFAGRLDSIYFWSKALTDGSVTINNTAGGEVAQLYNSGLGRDYPFDLKNYDGLIQTSLKTFNGLAFGTLKSFNGMT